MRKIILAAVIFFLLASYGYLQAQAQEAIGKITFAEGIFDITRDNQEALLSNEKDPIYLGDRVRTKSYSKAEITFVDKSVVKLAPNTCISIDNFKLGPDKKRELAHVNLTRGKIEAIVSKTGSPDTFLIDTPNTKGSVKGSDIFISYLGGRTGVFVQEGAISVLNPSLPDLKTKVTKGNCLFVPFDQAPLAERPALDVEMNSHKKDVARSLVKKWIPQKGSAQMNAVIVSLAGTARIYKKGAADFIPAKLNDTLFEGDKLQTTTDARIEIRLSNGNTLMLQANTELSINSLRYDPQTGNYENIFEMAHGRVSGVVEKVNKESTFKLKTPTVVCGVKGTYIEVFAPTVAEQASGAQTQVFFEGGNGDIASLITNQTQDLGAGQNVAVESSGNIMPPVFTSTEQRTSMLETWATAKTQDSYATAQIATGLDANAPQEQLPPPPPPPMENSNINSLAVDKTIEKLDLLSTLTFNEILKPLPPPIQSIYDTSLIRLSSTAGINGADMNLSLKSDGTWNGNISGTFTANVTDPWLIEFDNLNNDYICIENVNEDLLIGSSGSWDTSTFSGSILGTTPDKSLSAANIAGTYSSDGNFQGQASGTWHDL